MARKGVKFEVTPEVLRQVETLAGLGLDISKIAAVLGIHRDTIYATKARSEAFAQAIEVGKAKAEGVIGKALFDEAKKGNVPAIKWWETTRAGRSDKHVTEISGPEGAPVAIEVKDGFSDEERAARLAALLDRARARAAGSPAE